MLWVLLPVALWKEEAKCPVGKASEKAPKRCPAEQGSESHPHRLRRWAPERRWPGRVPGEELRGAHLVGVPKQPVAANPLLSLKETKAALPRL